MFAGIANLIIYVCISQFYKENIWLFFTSMETDLWGFEGRGGGGGGAWFTKPNGFAGIARRAVTRG